MKKYEILYDWLISHIALLCNSDEAETFADSVGLSNDSGFVEIIEKMRGLGDDLNTARAARKFFNKWDELINCLDGIERSFSIFTDFKPKKFRLFLLLAKKIVQTAQPAAGAPDLDEVDVNEEMFELRDLSTTLPISLFVRQNAQSFNDSILVFTCVDLSVLEEEITNSSISEELLFHFLARLQAAENIPNAHAVLVKKDTPPIDISAVEAFTKLVILASGKPVHTPRCYRQPPAIIDQDCFRAGIPYQQLNDIFDVLSEYNSRPEVLTKYLTLYHVIENFMFKLPIIELESRNGGRMFSIRDFRRLYKQVNEDEKTALGRLFNAIFSLPSTPGNTFQNQVINRWDTLITSGLATMDIEKVLGDLDLKKARRPMTHNEFKDRATVTQNFTSMVYALRNAIVHNKETEFHLTYATLDNAFCITIESFLIPCLEEMCFALVGSQNQHVWYTHKQLMLYR